MISNAVANSPASTGPVRSGNSGRASGDGDNAFRDVLEKSTKAGSDTPKTETESAEARPRSAFADTSWRSALGKAGDEYLAEGEAGATAPGEGLPEDGGSPVGDAAGERLAGSAEGQAEGEQMDTAEGDGTVVEEGAAQAQVPTDIAAKAASDNAAQGLARADIVASQNAQLPGRVSARDAKPSGDGERTGDVAKGIAANATGDTSADAAAGSADARAARSAMPNQAAAPERALPAARTAPAAEPPADGRTASAVRVTGEAPGEPRRIPVDLASAAAKPGAESSGAALKVSATAETVQGSGDGSTSRQIADAVAREMEELAPSRLTLNGSTAQGARTVKTMRLQLNPAELGTVNIRMQSVDGELRVTIQADSEQTSRMLHNDSDAIRSALRAAGIGNADVVVSANRNDPSQSQNFNAQQRDPSGQQAAAQENGRNASGESRQSQQDSSSNDPAQSQARGSNAGDSGTARGDRIVI